MDSGQGKILFAENENTADDKQSGKQSQWALGSAGREKITGDTAFVRHFILLSKDHFFMDFW